MLARRAAMTVAAALTVVGSAGGCHADRPAGDRIAVVEESPGRPADPLADLDAVLDSAEQDLDEASAER